MSKRKERTFCDIKRTRNHFTFIWALTNLFENGIDTCKEYADEEIERAYQKEIKRQEALPENYVCIYVPEVVRDMLLTARELANLPFDELMKGVTRCDFWNAHPIPWDRMSEIASLAIDGLREDDEESAIEYLRDVVELDDQESEYFGVTFEEE